MMIILPLFSCLIFSYTSAQYQQEYCLSHDDNPYLNFAKKTAYEFVHERENSRQHIVPECRPVQYWSLIRTGERLPGIPRIYDLKDRLPKIQKDIIRNYRELRSYPRVGRLCEEDLVRLEKWHWNSSYDTTNLITNEALNEMKFLARRIKTKFGTLFFSTNLDDYIFKHTNEARNSDSYKAFIQGLFDEEAYRVRNTETITNSSIMGNTQHCPAFERNIQATNDENSEPNKFLRRSEIQKMIKDVGEKLGYKYDLDFNQLSLMYEMCRVEKSIHVREISTWCAVFTKNQLKLFEYYYDLLYYYQSGYGNRYSVNIGCHHVKDMLNHFQQVVNKEVNDSPKSIISFTNSLQLQTLIVALDILKDPSMLTADSYNPHTKNSWRISEISPFGGNLAAVMYECVNSRYKVMFFLNERPIEHRECQVGLCDWDILYRRLRSVTDRCNLDLCTTGAASTMSQKFSWMLLLPLFLISAKKCFL